MVYRRKARYAEALLHEVVLGTAESLEPPQAVNLYLGGGGDEPTFNVSWSPPANVTKPNGYEIQMFVGEHEDAQLFQEEFFDDEETSEQVLALNQVDTEVTEDEAILEEAKDHRVWAQVRAYYDAGAEWSPFETSNFVTLASKKPKKLDPTKFK